MRRVCLSAILIAAAAACGSGSADTAPEVPDNAGAGGDTAAGGETSAGGHAGTAVAGGNGGSVGGTTATGGASLGGANTGGSGGAKGGESNGGAGAGGTSVGGTGGSTGGSGGSGGQGGATAGNGGSSVGGATTGGSGGSAGGSAGEGGIGGAGGSAGTSSGGFGANGGFGGACDPLDPTTCPGQRCGLVGNAFSCEPAGTGGDQEACTFDTNNADSCQAGFACILTPKTCYKICDPTKMNADCPANEPCDFTINVTGGPSFHVCHPKPPQCDPFTQDCPDTTKSCYPVFGGNECHATGMIPDGTACTFANDCVKGSVCENINSKQQCYHICDPKGGMPTCPSGMCMGFDNVMYGLCL